MVSSSRVRSCSASSSNPNWKRPWRTKYVCHGETAPRHGSSGENMVSDAATDAMPDAVQSWAGLVSPATARRRRTGSRSVPVANGQKEEGCLLYTSDAADERSSVDL